MPVKDPTIPPLTKQRSRLFEASSHTERKKKESEDRERERERDKEIGIKGIRTKTDREQTTREEEGEIARFNHTYPIPLTSRKGETSIKPDGKRRDGKKTREETRGRMGGYDLIQRPIRSPPGDDSNGGGCIFCSRAVCLVRDEYERIESKEFRPGKEKHARTLSRLAARRNIATRVCRYRGSF